MDLVEKRAAAHGDLAGQEVIAEERSHRSAQEQVLLNLLLKFMLVEGCETLLDLAERLKLPRRAVQQLLDEAVHQKLIQAVGAAPGGLALSIRHALSETGRAAAIDGQHGVTTVGQPLVFAVEAVAVASPRATVNVENQTIFDAKK